MNNQVAYWKPWYVALNLRKGFDEQIKMVKDLGIDTISIKGVDGTYVYGLEKNFSLLSLYRKYNNEAFEQAIKDAGLGLDMWCFNYCSLPVDEARTMHAANYRWQPRTVDLDMEQQAADNAAQVGTFLRSMGSLFRHDGEPVDIFLQSFRRPDLHGDLPWSKLLTYRDENGAYIVDGVNPQAYPYTHDFPGDFARMIDAYETLERQIGRSIERWRVTLPTFSEHGWTTSPDDITDGLDFLFAALGDKLEGITFWDGDWLIRDEFEGVRQAIRDYDWPGNDDDLPGHPDPAPAAPKGTMRIWNPAENETIVNLSVEGGPGDYDLYKREA